MGPLLVLSLPLDVRDLKSSRAFPFVRSRRALPQSSAVLHRLMGVLGNVLGNFRQNHPEVVQECVRASKKKVNWTFTLSVFTASFMTARQSM